MGTPTRRNGQAPVSSAELCCAASHCKSAALFPALHSISDSEHLDSFVSPWQPWHAGLLRSAALWQLNMRPAGPPSLSQAPARRSPPLGVGGAPLPVSPPLLGASASPISRSHPGAGPSWLSASAPPPLSCSKALATSQLCYLQGLRPRRVRRCLPGLLRSTAQATTLSRLNPFRLSDAP